MRVRVRLDGASSRRWHAALLARLATLPAVAIELDPAPGPGGLPANADLLFRFEAILARWPFDGLAAPEEPGALARHPSPGRERPDLVLDLCGDVASDGAERVWRLTFDGGAGEAALLAGLLAGRSPVAALEDDGGVVASGRPGTDAHGQLLAMFEDALARTITLAAAAVAGRGPRLAEEGAAALAQPLALSRAGAAAHAAGGLARAIERRLHRLCFRVPHWRVGWRRLDGPDLIDLRRMPEGWRDLPDDGRRFYADPFAIDHAGQTVLFVEEYGHRLGKGVVSAVAFGPGGPVGAPVPVLEEPYHLSYPFVFAREGEVWLVPESSANGTVDLYRATAFPGGWVKETTLLSGVAASDATLVEHGGRWWLFATVREPVAIPGSTILRGSFSDALHLWSAPDFRGPWTPHPGNPVLIDAAAARPAGRIVARGGALIRPVQDCRADYGAALALARIERLDAEGYAQRVETRLRPGGAWPGAHLHTLDRGRDFEFIDGSGRAPRFRRS